MLIDSPLLYLTKNSPPSEKYKFLSKVYTRDSYMLLCADCIAPSKFSNYYMHSPLRDWLKWVNVNIILQLGDISMSRKRLGVLLRIATNMLDKVSQIDDITRIELHSNLTHNVWTEYNNIQCEGLPF